MLRVSESSLDWALEHADKRGEFDVFPKLFEYSAIRHDWEEIKAYLARQDLGEWTVRSNRTLLAPKAQFGFRAITQLDPLDFLLYSAIVYEIAEDLERKRISRSEDTVFSYRVSLDPNGQLFDPSIGFRDFLNAAGNKLDNDNSIGVVAKTDISDFYLRIYHHRLENAIDNATSKSSHVASIKMLIKGWNGTETFGIPIGSDASRLLAEVTIANVDNLLRANGISFVRYNDDYYMFARDYSEGYRHLTFLADSLYRMHGLTLQQQKTYILPTDEFRRAFLATDRDRELDSLRDRFDLLVEDLGLGSWYQPIDYDELSDEQKELLDSFNLKDLLHEEIQRESEMDLRLVSFIIRRFSQLKDESAIDVLFESLDVVHPVLPDIVRYIGEFTSLDEPIRHSISDRLINAYNDSILGELDYHKMWLLYLFSVSNQWNQDERFFKLYADASDESSKRKLILAMGRAGQQHWFQTHWRRLLDFPAWTRRAVIAGASCMASDARRHWYRSIESHLDPLEKAITRWAREYPFSLAE